MNFKMAMALVFGIVISVAWVSSMSSAGDHLLADISIQSQVADR